MLGITMIFLLLTGCANIPNDSAICDGSIETRKALASNLLIDGGPLSQNAGADLLDQMAAGCN